MKIAVITVRAESGEAGGAERFYDALVGAFRDIGHDACEVQVLADESNFDQIKRNYLRCYDLDLSGYDVVVSTKAPTWMVRHPRHVCYLVHTIRVFYDMFGETFPNAGDELLAQRQLVQQLDTGALSATRCKAVFSIGSEVSRRLREHNGVEAEVLHPPLWANDFRQGVYSDYFLLPGRLHPWKRVDLVIRAMQHVTTSVRLLIVGTGEAEPALRELAAGDSRIQFLGRVDDLALRELYANALAVPFTPKREDYGYVTLEAFASGKPVITCTDSGEAAVLVRDGENGFVCEPNPKELAERMELLSANPKISSALGNNGKAWVSGLDWGVVSNRLIDVAMTE